MDARKNLIWIRQCKYNQERKINELCYKEFFWQPWFHDKQGLLVLNRLSEPTSVLHLGGDVRRTRRLLGSRR